MGLGRQQRAPPQLGDNTIAQRTVPVTVSGLNNVVEMGGGGTHACARKSDGTVWCWGDGTSGHLGNGGTTQSNVPVQVTGITTATSLAVGYDTTCVLLTGGSVKCWGYGANGQIGNNSTAQQNTPVSVTTNTAFNNDAVELTGHLSYTFCVRRTGGTVSCWGLNNNGQIGDGTMTQRNVPTAVVF